GGGIVNTGVLTISHSTLSGNAVTVDGGALHNHGTVTVDNSTLAGNTAGEFGGSIYNCGTLTVKNSTLSGNTASRGGGIYGWCGLLIVSNSTLSGNDGGSHGGGIFAYDTVVISSTTVSENAAEVYGSGIYYSGLPEILTLNNTIIANNSGAGNCQGNYITSLGHNLSSDGSCNLNGPGDLPDTDPLLGPLQDNGGPTFTYALLPGSPAIDAGDNSTCPETDQRGVLRPQGPACDIGAYEMMPAPMFFNLTKTVNDATPAPGQVITYTITVYNSGFLTTTTAAISDTLPGGLTFAGPMLLQPPQSGAILAQDADDLPALAYNLTITAWQSITLTWPVTVNADAPPAAIVNTAAVTSTEVITPATGSVVVEVCNSAITVTNDADSGPGSLRHAIVYICDGGNIDFDVSLPATITLTSGELIIDKPLTLHGPGADQLTISGNNASRIFDVSGSGVHLDGLTIRDGSADNGGGILNTGILTISHNALSGNGASADGGGIYNTGILTVSHSTLTNSHSFHGGGIYNGGGSLLAIRDSTFSSNDAYGGGGIYNNAGTLIVQNSTFSGNTAFGGGGDAGGGGIHNRMGGAVTISYSTISGNGASFGGGIRNYQSGTVTLSHTIVANSLSDYPDCDGGITSLGYNLDSDGSCNLTGPGDLPNTDPRLGPLQDNGGPTFTHALLPGSPAIDAGDDNNCPSTDQRGVPRPQGVACDMGAYEADWPATLLTLNYRYRMNNGSSGVGTYWLLANSTFVDESNGLGVWAFQPTPSPRLFLQYNPGFACNAFSIGVFTSPEQVFGPRVCRDGSGTVGVWVGYIATAFEPMIHERP
ncbi:MAG: DUF11 domain-containing protein, partial [Caldilineaceae bacterium]|nr:DUF11 domain-containing protein [Caldilineaceae bacterium]